MRVLLLVCLCICGTAGAWAADALQLKLTEHGLASLTYQGVEYCNPAGSGVLGFSGNPAGILDVQQKKEVFTATQTASAVKDATVTQTYPWGTLAATYTIKGDDLDVTATITNTSTTPIGWWKANLLQLNNRLVFDTHAQMPYGYTPKMHWDYRWAMWGGGADPYTAWNFTDPHVYWWVDSAAPFAQRQVKIFFADLDPKWSTGVAHVKTEQGDAWPVVGGADGDPGNAPQIAPGHAESVHVVIRFRAMPADAADTVAQCGANLAMLEQKVAAADANYHKLHDDPEADRQELRESEQLLATLRTERDKTSGDYTARLSAALPSATDVCADGYEAFGRAYPRTVHWTDRRPIGTYFAGRGAKSSPTNPNKWFNDPTVDTTTFEGCQAFAARLLADIDATIVVLKDVGAQGVIWWDVEGERWPQMTTYIGDPRVLDPAHPLHAHFAPELDTQVTYNGKQMKLVDACFQKWQDAGFKTGVTIRPNTVVWNNNAIQQITRESDLSANLCDKATYARERWGCTIFYIDSINEWFGNWWMEKTVQKYPDILLAPEWGRTRSYRHSAQFSYTKFTGFYRGVPAEMQACWPDAFCCMANYDYEKNADDALYAVKHGNIQFFNCWYGNSEAKKLKALYQQTGIKHIPWARDQQVAVGIGAVKITLHATDEDGDQLTFSTLGPPAHGSLSKLDAVTGTVSYSPTPGYVGKDRFSFIATDATGLRSNRGMVELTVGQVGPATDAKGQ